MERRAKIVCTLGPATDGRTDELIAAGMDVARLNMSHGSHEEHGRRMAEVRKAAEETGRPVAVLADLQGPKIRLGTFADGPVRLVPGDAFTITAGPAPGSSAMVSTSYLGLPGDVHAGDLILVDDGNVQLEVVRVDGAEVRTRVLVGGVVSDHKGMNLPGVAVAVPAMTDKDADDLRFALSLPVDVVALSFVRSASDIEGVRAVMNDLGVKRPVIAKVEKPQAVDAIDELVQAFDGVMVARGDLGVELPLEVVPMVQKRVIQACRDKAKPVIVATQMLESMIGAPRPTRAETSDVANAVLDGADAVMLSAETSVGAHPVAAVETMSRIIHSVEESGLGRIPPCSEPGTVGGNIAAAAVVVARRLGVAALVAFTETGDTARGVSRYRSPIPLLGFTPYGHVQRFMSLFWGVESYTMPKVMATDEMVRQVDERLLEMGRFAKGDAVVIVAGSPPGVPGSTNALRVHRIGAAVGDSAAAYRR